MAKKPKKKKNGRKQVQPAKLEGHVVQGAVAAGSTNVFEPEQAVVGSAEGAKLEPDAPSVSQDAQPPMQKQDPAGQAPVAVQTPDPVQDAQADAPASFVVTLPQREEKTSRTASLFIRLEPADKAALQLCAVRAGMTLAGYCRAILQSVARREGGDGNA
ncbi:MAG: hypothetical protein K6E40_03170 [Desulfovibrio sp.]|nr:hypothetical protein [Desulfovibrio sp.]